MNTIVCPVGRTLVTLTDPDNPEIVIRDAGAIDVS